MTDQLITSTVLLLFLLLLSLLLEKKVNPCLKYALWLLAAVKLLLPLPAFENPLNVLNVIYEAVPADSHPAPSTEIIPETEGSDNIRPTITSDAISNSAVAKIQPEGKTPDGFHTNHPSSDRKPDTLHILCTCIYISGMIVCACIFLWSNLRFRRYLRRTRTPAGAFRRGLPVFEVPGLPTPCLSGLFTPAIYLNSKRDWNDEQLPCILEHEYTHFRHLDHIWAMVRCLCVILYWYHPLVWLAAYRSAGDGELACDAGTLHRIGRKNAVPYGKTLIAAAQNRSRKQRLSVLECRTGAAGSMREMRTRIHLLQNAPRTGPAALIIVPVMCFGITGCTFGSAASKYGTSENLSGLLPPAAVSKLSAAYAYAEIPITAPNAPTASPDASDSESVLTSPHNSPDPDQVCVLIWPSELREYSFYYYIPTGGAQDRLQTLMNDLTEDWQKFDRPWEFMKESGYQICYQGKNYMAFDDGYLFALDFFPEIDFEPETVAFLPAAEICSYVQRLLEEELNYERIDITRIHDIVSARLDVCSLNTDWKFYSQTITDREILKRFENWFCNAQYIYGGADCGNNNACLELTFSDGSVIKLSIATDSCPNFGVNGVFYDYRPTPVWDNREFFRCFDEIPWEFI